MRNKILVFLAALLPALAWGQEERVQKLFGDAIQAMGGDAYLAVTDIVADGHLFYFNREGANSNRILFDDLTKLPDKSRFELGNNKKWRDITVFNLAKNEGWLLEGQKPIREATPEEMQSFKDAVKHSIETIFRFRYRDPQNKLFYLGPGQGSDVKFEMVKLLDPENDEVTIFFDRGSKLPVKIQYTTADKQGVQYRNVVEYSQWHNIQGINTPLRIDSYVNGRRSMQTFIFKVSYNTGLSDDFFSKPERPK